MRRYLWIGALACMATLLPCTQGMSGTRAADWTEVSQNGQTHLVVIATTKEKDRRVYQDAIRKLCAEGQACFIFFWNSDGPVPNQFPFSKAENDAMVANYVINPQKKYRQIIWNCRIEPDPNVCFK